MLRKFGALPFIGIALLAGVFMAGRYSAPSTGKPVEKTAVKPASSGLLGSLFQSVGGNGTQVKLYKAGDAYDPAMTLGNCLYCHSTLAITGDKGSDRIKCPNCGGTMTALKAILYFNSQVRRFR
jgi:DNA-directed RNA polymerase subunit RPC12/RpoP